MDGVDRGYTLDYYQYKSTCGAKKLWRSDARKHCPGIAGHLLTRKLQQQYISEREECAHIPVQSGEDYCTAMNWTDDHLAKSRPPHACKPATRKYHLPTNCPPEFPQKKTINVMGLTTLQL